MQKSFLMLKFCEQKRLRGVSWQEFSKAECVSSFSQVSMVSALVKMPPFHCLRCQLFFIFSALLHKFFLSLGGVVSVSILLWFLLVAYFLWDPPHLTERISVTKTRSSTPTLFNKAQQTIWNGCFGQILSWPKPETCMLQDYVARSPTQLMQSNHDLWITVSILSTQYDQLSWF